MELVVIFVFLFSSVVLVAYQFSSQKIVQEVHLPSEMRSRSKGKVGVKGLLGVPSQFIERFSGQENPALAQTRRNLVSAGMPMNVSQFLAMKFLLITALPISAAIFLNASAGLLLILGGIGYIMPDFWLKGQVKKRQTAILKDLPHVIDLLNICVSSGLDFMVAVNRVIGEFRPSVLVQELRILIHEIQMGVSRREALKNFSRRINSQEIISFVRTLTQADRMGTPIGQALKMQAEEIRSARFQKGEEAALKAPIKLLLPLLVFIMPVVLIIVAGPILIQFTRGNMIKF